MEAKTSHWMKLALAALVLVGTVVAEAQMMRPLNARANRCTMIPPNRMWFPLQANTGISEDMFNKVIDAVEKVYAPVVAKKGGQLVVERRWTDNTVNAYADRSGKTWRVSMFGGLARHPETTPDAFAMVVCHELGHHIGGTPHYGNGIDWASTEGQSDYYASLKCMRTVLEQIDNWGALRNLYRAGDVDPLVHERCQTAFPDKQGYAVCLRGALGGKALARLLSSLGGDKMPEFNTPDTTVVKRTNENHPRGQCRLDTYFAGAVCPVPHKTDISNDDPNQGVCTRKTVAPTRRLQQAVDFGFRPACWYAQAAGV